MFFADDARQAKPTRPGMGSLVATGGIRVGTEIVTVAQRRLDNLCASAGFPIDEPFKWSPGRELWMRDHLVGDERRAFYSEVVHTLGQMGATVTVVVEDATCRPATKAQTAEADAVTLLLERVNHQCGRSGSVGIVVADRPGGGQREQEEFLLGCSDVLRSGTAFTLFDNVGHVATSPLRSSRLLQAADLVTSCTLAFVSGEVTFSPPVFELILPLLDRHDGRVGGRGLKVHPDGRYANLYHWLLGDLEYIKGNEVIALPSARWPYLTGPGTFR